MELSVIIVSPEAAPFAKTGGLADVAGSLPVALRKLGCKVALFLPYYREVAESGAEVEVTGLEVTVPSGRRTLKAQVLRSTANGLPVYFLKRDEYYDRTYLYGTPEGDYFDNLERFAFFSRGVLEALKARGFEPDVIHCHDWQTGLVPAYLKDVYKNDLYYSRTATVFTIHNMAYQGTFDGTLFDLTGLAPSSFTPERLEFWGKVNLMKGGLACADALTTVSEGYSKEIQTREYGWGLEGLLRKRKDDLHGILNGVDYDVWDPATDKLIPSNYSQSDLRGKSVCKKALLKEFGLKIKADAPLIGMITRLADQKGLDILCEAMPTLMEMNLGVVMLGSGDKKYQDQAKELESKYPKKFAVRLGFDDPLAHMIEAGSDIFLMPSRYEPCGLNQIYSLKYGTVPLVRATGGLDDTVEDYAEGEGTGFKFRDYTAEALTAKIREAATVYKDKPAWESLQKRGMKKDFSWEFSAKKYIELYSAAHLKLLKNSPSVP